MKIEIPAVLYICDGKDCGADRLVAQDEGLPYGWAERGEHHYCYQCEIAEAAAARARMRVGRDDSGD